MLVISYFSFFVSILLIVLSGYLFRKNILGKPFGMAIIGALLSLYISLYLPTMVAEILQRERASAELDMCISRLNPIQISQGKELDKCRDIFVQENQRPIEAHGWFGAVKALLLFDKAVIEK